MPQERYKGFQSPSWNFRGVQEDYGRFKRCHVRFRGSQGRFKKYLGHFRRLKGFTVVVGALRGMLEAFSDYQEVSGAF